MECTEKNIDSDIANLDNATNNSSNNHLNNFENNFENNFNSSSNSDLNDNQNDNQNEIQHNFQQNESNEPLQQQPFENLVWFDVFCNTTFELDYKKSIFSFIIADTSDLSVIKQKIEKLELFQYKKKPINSIILKKLIKTTELAIIEMMREIGFFDVKVYYQLKKIDDKHYKLHFKIQKGNQYSIGNITLTDNIGNVISCDLSEKNKKNEKKKKNKQKINSENNSNGQLNNDQINNNKTNQSQNQNSNLISQSSKSAPSIFTALNEILNLYIQYKASIKNFQSIIKQILYKYKCFGYLDVAILRQNAYVDHENQKVNFQLSIDVKHKKYIGKIFVRQRNGKIFEQFINNNFISNRVKFHTGNIFNIDKIEDAKINLLDTAIFSKVAIDIYNPNKEEIFIENNKNLLDCKKSKNSNNPCFTTVLVNKESFVLTPAKEISDSKKSNQESIHLQEKQNQEEEKIANSYPLLIQLNQEKQWMLEAGLMYCIKQTNKTIHYKENGLFNKLKNLYGKLGITKFNVFGNGEKLSFHVNGNLMNRDNKKSDYEARLTLQMYDTFRRNFLSKYFIEYMQEETNAYLKKGFNCSATLDMPYNDSFLFSAGIAFENGTVSNYVKELKQRVFSIPLAAYYKNVDNIYNPSNGIVCGVGITNYFSNIHYLCSLKFDTFFYKSLFNNCIVFLKICYMHLFFEKLEKVAYDKRLYSGGRDSVRGYGYQLAMPVNLARKTPIGQRQILESTIEFTYKMSQSFSIATFIDGAYSFDKLAPQYKKLNRFYAGYGVGARYYTRLGPIKLDLAFPCKKREKIDSNLQVIISFGVKF